MNQPNSQSIRLLLVGVALATILFWAAPRGITSSGTLRNAGKTSAPNDLATNPDLIRFSRGVIDTSTRADLDTAETDASFLLNQGHGGNISRLRIVQFNGPIRREWIERLKATGAEIAGFIPNNAYVIRATISQIAEISAWGDPRSADDSRPIRWMGRVDPIFKIDPKLDDGQSGSSQGVANVDIELLNSTETAATTDYINSLALSINHEPRRFLNFIVLSVTLPAAQLLQIARFDEVLFVGPTFVPELHDERGAQI